MVQPAVSVLCSLPAILLSLLTLSQLLFAADHVATHTAQATKMENIWTAKVPGVLRQKKRIPGVLVESRVR